MKGETVEWFIARKMRKYSPLYAAQWLLSWIERGVY